MKKNDNSKIFLIMVLPTLISVILLTFVPVLSSFFIAFQNYDLHDLSNIHFIGFENFQAVFNDVNFNFLRILLNTFLWVIVSLFFQFVLGLGLALLMKKPFKGRGIYSGLVFYPWALSGFAIGLIWAWMFNGQFGIINDILQKIGLIHQNIGFLSDTRYSLMSVIIANIWYGIPFFAIMLLAALQSVPLELYEAAEIDGAGYFIKLFKITIPYIKPVIINTVLLRTIWIINFPEMIYAMTGGGPANSSNILSVQMINKIMNFLDFGEGAAIGVMIIIIMSIYVIIYLKIISREELTF
ncbi:MAG: sugar ABC transporter permease [Actinobacteria bacterium]|nr:sugar ABC transporter permease [Actinomycetota bacterium]MBE3114901.1 sugar ABC transporter permease [Actinomycetota bacterium]